MSVSDELCAQANPEKAAFLRRFFQAEPGGYGEGDAFLGLTVPVVRRIVRQRKPEFAESIELLRSKYHEERLAALVALVRLYERGDDAVRQRVFDAYLASTDRINNWDLVDTSAPQIVGAHLLATGKTSLLDRLARSRSLWERRIAILATFAFIRAGRFDVPLRIAERLVGDPHDLIHKAVGWMLREIGTRDVERLREFLWIHAATMPRTMLRYAIEKLSPGERARWRGLR